MRIDLPHPLAGSGAAGRQSAASSRRHRSRILGHRRCSASTRRTVLRERLGLSDAALDDLAARGVIQLRAVTTRKPIRDPVPRSATERAMNGITRKPAFWIAFAASPRCRAASSPGGYFPQALPLVNLDVKMTRDEALAQAAALADAAASSRRPDARRAALFAHDGATQNFVELEGGGKPAFAALLDGRRSTRRTGGRCGCSSPARSPRRACASSPTARRTVSRAACRRPTPGAALDAAAARAIAETSARDRLGDRLRAVQAARAIAARSARTAASITVRLRARARDSSATAAIRLRLGVTGDELTELTHFVHVPEAFERRFQEMRFANNTIAERRQPRRPARSTDSAAASSACCGCCAGAGCSWRPALVAGAVVAGLNALALLANAPQAWFGFDTAQPTAVFWLQQVGVALLVFVGGGLALRARVHGGGEPVAPRVSRSIRSSGGSGRAMPRRRRRCSAARSAATSSCRSSSR